MIKLKDFPSVCKVAVIVVCSGLRLPKGDAIVPSFIQQHNFDIQIMLGVSLSDPYWRCKKIIHKKIQNFVFHQITWQNFNFYVLYITFNFD